jgi:hypothetical protein
VRGSRDKRGGREGLGAWGQSEHCGEQPMAVRAVVGARGVATVGGTGLGGHVVGVVPCLLAPCPTGVGKAPR